MMVDQKTYLCGQGGEVVFTHHSEGAEYANESGLIFGKGSRDIEELR